MKRLYINLAALAVIVGGGLLASTNQADAGNEYHWCDIRCGGDPDACCNNMCVEQFDVHLCG